MSPAFAAASVVAADISRISADESRLRSASLRISPATTEKP
jgi:hypothetical protein